MSRLPVGLRCALGQVPAELRTGVVLLHQAAHLTPWRRVEVVLHPDLASELARQWGQLRRDPPRLPSGAKQLLQTILNIWT